MAGIIGNLIYRASISAIIGAGVAGGLVYLSADRNAAALRSDVSALTAKLDSAEAKQNETNKALMEANDNLASALGALESGRDAALGDVATEVSALQETLNTVSSNLDGFAGTAKAQDLDAISAKLDALAVRLYDLSKTIADTPAPAPTTGDGS